MTYHARTQGGIFIGCWYAERAHATGSVPLVNFSFARPTWTLCPSQLAQSISDETANNRMTFEKHQRDAKKKRKAEEKRALRQKKKERNQSESEPAVEAPSIDESTEN